MSEMVEGFKKKKMGQNHHFMTTLEDFQAKCKEVDANGKDD